MEKLNKKGSRNMQIWVLLALVVLLLIVFSAISPDNFLKGLNFQNMGFQMSEFGIIALAMGMIILTGGINLAVVQTAAVSSIIGGLVAVNMYNGGEGAGTGISILVFILVTLAISVVCGIINGLVVSYIGVSPILVTLATTTIFEGIGLNITKGSSLSGFPDVFKTIGSGTVVGIPVPLLIFVVVVLLCIFLLQRTPWGVSVYMMGSNSKATMFSGINIKTATLRVYILSAILSGVAAVIMASRYNSVKTDYGSSYLMQSVAAVVLGGTAITGGSGTVIGTVLAVALLQVVSSGLNILGANRNITDIITGLILLGVLAANYIMSLRSARKPQKAPHASV